MGFMVSLTKNLPYKTSLFSCNHYIIKKALKHAQTKIYRCIKCKVKKKVIPAKVILFKAQMCGTDTAFLICAIFVYVLLKVPYDILKFATHYLYLY